MRMHSDACSVPLCVCARARVRKEGSAKCVWCGMSEGSGVLTYLDCGAAGNTSLAPPASNHSRVRRQATALHRGGGVAQWQRKSVSVHTGTRPL
jgi:hypothetical protein